MRMSNLHQNKILFSRIKMLILPPVPVPKIKGIDPDLLKVINKIMLLPQTPAPLRAGDSPLPLQPPPPAQDTAGAFRQQVGRSHSPWSSAICWSTSLQADDLGLRYWLCVFFAEWVGAASEAAVNELHREVWLMLSVLCFSRSPRRKGGH